MRLLAKPFPLAVAAIALRAAMLLYGMWQDATLDVKYTDVDYLIVTEAAALFRDANGSPYDRTTYRYTPLYAWIAAYVPAPRVLFALADVAAGAILLAEPLSLPPLSVACSWLLNPYVANISTRGSTDSLTAVVVLLALAFTLKSCHRFKSANSDSPSERNYSAIATATAAGASLGTATHLRLYPAIFVLPLSLHYLRSNNWRLTASPFVAFVIGGALAFLSLAALAAWMHGWWPFLYNTYLYHFTRTDHRHNFSVYSYAMNIGAGIPPLVPLLAMLVGISIVGASPVFAHDPASAMFFQCYLFVAFNKVMTSQYAIWFLSLLPAVLPRLKRRLSVTRGIMLLALWISAQGIWLYFAYHLEFHAQNTYRQLFVACIGFFAANIYILGSLMASYEAIDAHIYGNLNAKAD